MMKNDNIFLKGLNELRAVAALGVLVHHIELLKYDDRNAYSLANNTHFHHFIQSLGKHSVYFFFVLSGFLITHLIVREKKKFGVFDKYTQSFVISIFFLSFIILTVNNHFYFRSKIFDEMGKISYGIYMYHPFIMFLVFPVLGYLKTLIFRVNSGGAMFFLLVMQYILTIGITLFISYFSYNYIEKKFLMLKEKKYSRL